VKTEYVLGAEIPVGDITVRVGQENDVVTDVFDRFLIDVIGSPVGRAALGEVSIP
jgi:hypothetical protein